MSASRPARDDWYIKDAHGEVGDPDAGVKFIDCYIETPDGPLPWSSYVRGWIRQRAEAE